MQTTEERIAAEGMQYTTPTSQQGGLDPSALYSEIQKRALATSDMISSANTGLDASLERALAKSSGATEAGSKIIESKYGREIESLKGGLEGQLTAARERGVGINTSDVAYKSMAAEADKQIKDLEQRKNELILQNDREGAREYNQLIFQTLTMKNQAMQQTFQNLMAMNQFGLQVRQEERAARAQTFAEQQAESTIGLQYGVSRRPNESWDSFISRASVNADKKQTLELAKLSSEIATQKALRNKAEVEAAKGGRVFDQKVLNEWMADDPEGFALAFKERQDIIVDTLPGGKDIQKQRRSEKAYNAIMSGQDKESVLKEIMQESNLSDYETTKSVMEAIDKALQDKPKNQGLFGAAKETLAGIKIKQSERTKGRETKPLMGEYFQGSPINEFSGYFK